MGPDATITLSSAQPGERLEGQLRSGTFFGRYFPSEGGPAEGFSFRASPAESWKPTPPLKVWNLTGAWVLQTGPTEQIEIVLAHRDHSLRTIWKERDGTVRYLAGRLEGKCFALEVWRENRVVFGRYTPEGVLRGEWTDPDGSATTFQMRRKAAQGKAGSAFP